MNWTWAQTGLRDIMKNLLYTGTYVHIYCNMYVQRMDRDVQRKKMKSREGNREGEGIHVHGSRASILRDAAQLLSRVCSCKSQYEHDD